MWARQANEREAPEVGRAMSKLITMINREVAVQVRYVIIVGVVGAACWVTE